MKNRIACHSSIMVFCLVVCLLENITPSQAQQFPDGHRYSDLDVDDCEQLCSELWSDFLEEEQDSAATLGVMILRRGLRVPRFSHDAPSVMRDVAFFMVNSINNTEVKSDFMESFRGQIFSLYWEFFDDEYYQYEACVDEESDPTRCIVLAVEHRIIPSREQYRMDIEAAVEAGAAPICDDWVVGP